MDASTVWRGCLADSLSSQADVVRSRGINRSRISSLASLRSLDHVAGAWASILWCGSRMFWYVRRQLRETAEMSCECFGNRRSSREPSRVRELSLATFITIEQTMFKFQLLPWEPATSLRREEIENDSVVECFSSLSWRGAVPYSRRSWIDHG